MDERYSNCCLNILYEIRHSLAFDRIRNEWTKFRQQHSPGNTSSENAGNVNYSVLCDDLCFKHNSQYSLTLTNNKLCAQIYQDTDKATMSKHIDNGIFTFYLDLFYGSTQQNLDVIVRLQEVALYESELFKFSIPISVFLKISPRQHFIGKLTRNKNKITLRKGQKITLTVDRKYASSCCHSTMYVNAKFLIQDVRKCDIISLGTGPKLQVESTTHHEMLCIVITPGIVTSRMPVKFPPNLNWTQAYVSAEEIEDITFAMGTNINVIASCEPIAPTLHASMNILGCPNFYHFTFIKLSDMRTLEDARILAKTYDGFILDCTQEAPDDEVVKLSLVVRRFIEKVYSMRKPLFLKGCWSKIVHPLDYVFAFYYPEKYLLPCSEEFRHLFEAVFSKYGPKKCTDLEYRDRSITSSNLIARSIVATSYDIQADAIVMCTIVGNMAEKIAHFRPRAPIIAVTSLPAIINYSSMHHNVWMLAHETNKKDTNEVLSHKKETHLKLVYGLMYARQMNIVCNHSAVVLVFRRHRSYGFTDRFAIMRYNDNYVETIKNIVMKR